MKSKLTEWLVKPYLNESPDLDIKVGDDILMGRFKNKRVKVKSITYNEKGDLLINGRPALKFRKVKNDKKLLPSKTTKKSSAEPDADRKGVDDEYPFHKTEAKRVPRKKGQHRGSSSHSDLHGLKFATVDDAKKSVSKIRGSGKTHAHKIQAAVAMEQRAREMGKTAQAAVYRAYINQMKKKTKKKNESFAAVAGALYGGDIPSPSRKGSKDYTFGPDWIPTSLAQRKKMKRIHQKTSRSSRVGGKKNESMGFGAVAGALYGGDIPSPSRKRVKKNKKKGHSSVPYGSGYKKVNEQKEVKKVVVIYPGRFQPFGPHHKKVYDALSKQFDEAYITTSDIQRLPRHPLNFNEKKKHMMKMGVPGNRIIKEKVPYVWVKRNRVV